jgi:DNA repair protein RadD
MQNSLFEREVDRFEKMRPLRPRQLQAIAEVRDAIKEGHRRIVLQAPTGFGKTLVSAHIIAAALRKDSKPLFTCPAISLVDQTLTAFEREGIHDIGVMQAQHSRTNRNASVQIASVQTLIRRAAPEVDFALIDEAHESFEGLETMLDSEEWKNKIVIGLSATPWAKGMGLRWTKLVIAATINDLIADGHATPAVIYGPEKDVDRGSIKIVKGEFDEAGSAAAMSDDAIVGDVLKEWKEKSPREKTFVFCVNRAHAQVQMEAFLDAGIPFGYIDANTPQEERKRQFKQMRYGEIAGIASVGCLIRGVDEDVRCIVDLQLTKSEMRHVQKWGRGVRTAEGKSSLIGLDHAGNNAALGLFTDIFHDHLDSRKPGERGESYKDDYKPAKPKKCAKCHNLIPPKLRNCPSCNERVALNTGVTVVDGRLVEIGSGPKIDMKERQEWYSGFLWLAKQQNKRDGWAAHSYRERFGAWPSKLRVRAKKPSEAVVEYAKQRRAEYLAKVAVPVAVPAPEVEQTA